MKNKRYNYEEFEEQIRLFIESEIDAETFAGCTEYDMPLNDEDNTMFSLFNGDDMSLDFISVFNEENQTFYICYFVSDIRGYVWLMNEVFNGCNGSINEAGYDEALSFELERMKVFFEDTVTYSNDVATVHRDPFFYNGNQLVEVKNLREAMDLLEAAALRAEKVL